MLIFNKAEFADVVNKRISNKGLDFVVKEAKFQKKAQAETTVFLSHAHGDVELVRQTVAFLRSLHATAYVDWMDETISEPPNAETASTIRMAINDNDKFVLLATNAAIASKWCNWEIGIADIVKLSKDKFCLLPLADTNGDWKGNEYLQLYPRVEPLQESYGKNSNIFRLRYPDGKCVWFDEWLKK